MTRSFAVGTLVLVAFAAAVAAELADGMPTLSLPSCAAGTRLELPTDASPLVLAFDGVDLATAWAGAASYDPLHTASAAWHRIGRYLWADVQVMLRDADGGLVPLTDVRAAMGATAAAARAALDDSESLSRGECGACGCCRRDAARPALW